MGLFEHWPYVNFHDLNLDWIINKIKNVETAEANSQASAEASAESAAASQLSADASLESAGASQQSAESSQQSAEDSQESAEASAASELSAKNYADHIADPVSGLVTGWLNDHVTPTTPIVDNTLTISGAAADSKVTGDKFKNEVEVSHTVNLFDPIHKEGTDDGIAYSFENGTLHMAGTKTGWVVIQNISGEVGDVMSLSSMALNEKPPIYIRDGSTNVATLASASFSATFTLPVQSVQLVCYVSGTFDYTFTLTLIKNAIASFPLHIYQSGENTIHNFSDCTYEAIGDSLTYGFTGSWDEHGQQIRVADPYPDVVKNILGFKTALNKGETGTTIANDPNTQGTYEPISSDNRIAGYSYAQVISVMGGTNDYTLGTSLGTVYDTQNLATFHAGWKRVLSSLLSRYTPNNSFIFVIIPPVTQAMYTDNSAGHKWIDYINATIEECRMYGIPILDMSVMGRLAAANKNYYTSDGIHFNQLYISRVFAPMISDFIKRNCH